VCSKIIFRKKSYLLFIILGITFTLTACSFKPKPVTKTHFVMGTIAKITIYDKVVNDTVFTKAFNRIQEIEDKLTINKETDRSEIIRLNKHAGGDFVKLSPDAYFVLEKGKHYSQISNGKFDITIGPIIKLWNIFWF